ncbi:MAG TPA: hypothetical protein VFE27_14665, partial [Acidobacteriaceae bacterium]|nr:hypothetical protein [Acidobacteriaceae bacterium]
PERSSKAERRAQATTCIADKFSELYASNPVHFIEQAYFECVKGLKVKAKAVATEAFGTGHPYLEALFVKHPESKASLSDLRSELAHGGMTLLDKGHEQLIRQRVDEMGIIAREFLLRVLFKLTPEDKVPSWSQVSELGMNTADPRSTMWTTTDKVFPPMTSWKIRPEWCE